MVGQPGPVGRNAHLLPAADTAFSDERDSATIPAPNSVAITATDKPSRGTNATRCAKVKKEKKGNEKEDTAELRCKRGNS